MKKAIIKRNLPLNVKYACIDKKYIPLIDGFGCTCDNCGKLIANIATVKSNNGVYSIGFDCLETFLLNNNILDGFDKNEIEVVKKRISQIINVSKKLKETIENNKWVNGMAFEPNKFKSDYYTFYWLQGSDTKGRNNDYVKVKGMDFDFMISTLKNIFPKMRILVTD